MTGLWRIWMTLWCLSIGLFGIILTGGALEATSEPIRLLLSIIGGGIEPEFTPTLRFSFAIMGPITIGWCLTLLAAIRATDHLDHAAARSVWILITASALVWYLLDSALSVATGFAMNVIPNTLYIVTYLIPVLASGVLRR